VKGTEFSAKYDVHVPRERLEKMRPGPKKAVSRKADESGDIVGENTFQCRLVSRLPDLAARPAQKLGPWTRAKIYAPAEERPGGAG